MSRAERTLAVAVALLVAGVAAAADPAGGARAGAAVKRSAAKAAKAPRGAKPAAPTSEGELYVPILRVAANAEGAPEVRLGRGRDHGLAPGQSGWVFAREEKHGRGDFVGKLEIVSADAKEAIARPTTAKVESLEVGGQVVFKVAAAPPGIHRGALFELARLNVVFLDNSRQPIATVDALLTARGPEVEARALASMVEACKEVLEYTHELKQVVTHGAWKGKTTSEILPPLTPDGVAAFLRFVLEYPGKYLGHDWKISETFATWIINDTPLSLEDELAELQDAGAGAALPAQAVSRLRAAMEASRAAARRHDGSEARAGAALDALLAELAEATPGPLGGRLATTRARVLGASGRPAREVARAYRRAAELYRASGDLKESWGARAQALRSLEDQPDEIVAEYAVVVAELARAAAAEPDPDRRHVIVTDDTVLRAGADVLLRRGQYARIVADLGPIVKAQAEAAAASQTTGKSDPTTALAEVVARAHGKLGHLEEAVALYEGRRDARDRTLLGRARLEHAIGSLWYGVSQWEKAAARFASAVQRARDAGAPADEARALAAEGQALWGLGRHAEAVARHAEGMKLRRATGDREGIAWQRLQVASIQVAMGDRAAAEKEYLTLVTLYQQLGRVEDEAQTHQKLGELYCDLERADPCEAEYRSALQLYRRTGDAAHQPDALTGIGRAHLVRKAWGPAVEAMREAIALQKASGDASGRTWTTLWLARILARQGDARAAAAEFEQVLTLAASDPAARAEALLGLADLATSAGRLEEAFARAQAAVALAEDAKDPERRIRALEARAAVRYQAAEYVECMADHDRAFELARGTGKRPLQAEILGQRAWALLVLGRLAEAAEAAAAAEALHEKNADPVARAWALNTRANVAGALGDLARAAAAYDEALALAVSAGATYVEAALTFNRALIAIELRDLDGALAALDRVSALTRQGLSTAELEVATLKERGEILTLQQKLGPAEAALTQALARARTAVPRRVPQILIQLGELQARRGERAEALAALQEAERIESGRPGRPYRALAALGKLHALAREDDAALAALTEAVSRATAEGGAVPWEPLYHLGLVQSRRGDRAAAIATLERAVRAIERGEVLLADDRARARYRADKVDAYHLLVKLLLQDGKPDDALRHLERAKSTELAEFSRKAARPDDPAEAMAVELDVREAQLQRLADAERAKPDPDPEKLRRLEAVVEEVRRRRGEFIDALDRNSAVFDRYAMRPLELEKLQQHLPDGVLVVSPVVLDDRVVTFAVTSTVITHFEVATERGQVARLVEALRAGVAPGAVARGIGRAGPAAPPRAGDEALLAAARQLYDLLLRPALEQVGTPRLLAISASGLLRYVPFGALHDGKEWVAARTPLLMLTTLDRERLGAAPPGPATRPTVLALADPDGSLPGARREVEAVRGIIPGTTVLAGADASKSALRAAVQRPGYDVVHLATHGRLDAAAPERSHILLAGEPLYYPDIPALSLSRTRVVILSACETAVGARGSGIEIAGLAYQFERTRVRSVVASLWAVDDAATAALMERFYAGLREGKGVADAMAAAQRALISGADAAWRHPAFWAPFVVMGAP